MVYSNVHGGGAGKHFSSPHFDGAVVPLSQVSRSAEPQPEASGPASGGARPICSTMSGLKRERC
jgi:hypothetical protein